jgi:hypothetical protein
VLAEERKKWKESGVVEAVESVPGQQARREVGPFQAWAWAYQPATGRCKVDHDNSSQSDWSLHSSKTRHTKKPSVKCIHPEYLIKGNYHERCTIWFQLFR